MKPSKLLISIVLTILAATGFGQSVFDKGNYQLAGSLMYQHNKSNYINSTNNTQHLNLAPEFSYYVIDHLLIGGLVSYSYSKSSDIWAGDENDYNRIYKSIGFGPGIKYYFKTESLIPFIGSSIAYHKRIGSAEHFLDWNISCGLDFFIAKNLALEPFVNYQLKQYLNSDNHSTRISAGLRLNFFIIK